MVQKAEIIVEKFDEGITTRWHDLSGDLGTTKSLAKTGDEAQLIGEDIWADVFNMFDKLGTDKVRVKLEYEVVE
jgi:hypothetical protein